MNFFEEMMDLFSPPFGISSELQHRVFSTLIFVLILWIIRRIVLVFAYRRYEDIRVRYGWRKFSLYFVFALGFLIIGRIWFSGFQSLSTYLGLLSAGLAIALREPLVNLAGWLFIVSRRPFSNTTLSKS